MSDTQLMDCPGGQQLSILVVDDEDDVRDLIRDILESGGHRVVTASDGRGAITHLERNATDLLIIDLVMPEQEGIETIGMVRRQWPLLKILAISGSYGPFLKMAKILGAQDTLPKPFSCEALATKVDDLMALAR